MRRGALLAVLVLAGCGGAQRALPAATLPAAVATELASLAGRPSLLQRRAITAVNAHRVPASLQEPLLSRVNALATEPTPQRRRDLVAWLRARSRR